ncbi:MAG: GGDEF domain-containing protein [Adlercreutzia sp.]
MREKEELRRANERLEIITALSNDVLFDIECGTGAAHVYGDFEGRFGRPPEQEDFVVSRRCQKPCELTITSHDLTPLMAQIGENSLVDFETSTSGADGYPVRFRHQSVVLYDEEGGPAPTVGRLLDTSEAAMRESQFRRKAERDSLTGLYNRAAALDRIETALRTESRPCTLIVVDVDDFKAVNDSSFTGHPEGDYVLKRLAIFLSQVMRKEDIVARIGGDEFLIFAPGLASGPAADRVLGAFGPRALCRSARYRRGRPIRPISRGAHHQRGRGLLPYAAYALRCALRSG